MEWGGGLRENGWWWCCCWDCSFYLQTTASCVSPNMSLSESAEPLSLWVKTVCFWFGIMYSHITHTQSHTHSLPICAHTDKYTHTCRLVSDCRASSLWFSASCRQWCDIICLCVCACASVFVCMCVCMCVYVCVFKSLGIKELARLYLRKHTVQQVFVFRLSLFL